MGNLLSTVDMMMCHQVPFNEVLTVNSLLQGLPQLHRAAMPSTMPVSGCPESIKGWRDKAIVAIVAYLKTFLKHHWATIETQLPL